MTWQVEHAREASQAPSKSISFAWAASNILVPSGTETVLSELSRNLKENSTISAPGLAVIPPWNRSWYCGDGCTRAVRRVGTRLAQSEARCEKARSAREAEEAMSSSKETTT
eukprot:CAMPEP_0194755914 /NCGR_PEP_ID=MMETSP0323_2-20130528/9713_1 /TAXON_ID=2866 ORGANISM="Crypthecodinium cohnii, Strain Seligo" /NCGR_SAMPLE_ID=MMETSP0323_2 /ASSEMBLY_ACC=CAM_ASM_000346 /LENGTH=111 /DNA_ID=CAMNT_0039675195 /DNA_START=225 /DNA_END=560 /DNA_ORIENTATION=-